MEPTTDQLKKQIREFEKILRIGENDVAIEAYNVFVGILAQQNEILGKFVIEKNITAAEKTNEAVAYKNAKELWEKLPSLIKAVISLREDLGIKRPIVEGEKLTPLTAKEIANSHVLPD
jgi:hypothetical protein